MKRYLYMLVELIAKVHSRILEINDGYEGTFTDKELHFWVIGLLGIAMVLVLDPLFHWLAKKGLTSLITLLYVFSALVVITFGIEIGQGLTHTGVMEFADIMYGLVGFLIMYVVISVIRIILMFVVRLFRK